MHVEGAGGPADRGRCGVRRRGIGLAGAAAVGLLLAEAQLARRRVGNGTSPHVPHADGLYGASYTVPGEPALRLTMLGDSTAAGQGVHRAGQTPGALIASGSRRSRSVRSG